MTDYNGKLLLNNTALLNLLLENENLKDTGIYKWLLRTIADSWLHENPEMINLLTDLDTNTNVTSVFLETCAIYANDAIES